MKIRFLLLFTLFLIAAQDSALPAITSPAAEDVLRGQVTITGNTDIPGFIFAQLDFSYASNPTNTWFNIQTFSQPASESTLAVWDTTSISDGDYVLRLRVSLGDGTFQEATVPVTVMNDVSLSTPTPIPTSTAEPEIAVQVPTPFLLAASPTPTELPRPTPSPLPPNPASLGQNQIYSSLGRGALVMVGLFVFAGLVIRLRRF